MKEHRKRRILIKLAMAQKEYYDMSPEEQVAWSAKAGKIVKKREIIAARNKRQRLSALPKGPYPRDTYGDLAVRMGGVGGITGRGESKEVYTQAITRKGDPAGLTKARRKLMGDNWEWKHSDDNTHGAPSPEKQIRWMQSDLKEVETKLRSSDKKKKDKAVASGTGGYESELHQMSLPLKKRVKPEGIESDDRMQSIAYKPGGQSKVREKTLKSLKKSTKSVGTVSSKPDKSESSSSSSKSEKSESSSKETKDTSSKDTSSSESSSKSSKSESKKS